MSDFDKRFAAFDLKPEKLEELKSLSEQSFVFKKRSERVMVETVIVESGDRKIVSSEPAHAKLV